MVASPTVIIDQLTPGTVVANRVVLVNSDKVVDILGVATNPGKIDEHTVIKSVTDTKTIKLNSRNYTQTSGDASGVQVKPNQSVTGTAGITGMEISPRFAAGIGGNSLVAIKADPLLKAGTGDLTGAVTAVQANIDFGISGTRTITGDVSAFESFLAIPSSYTYSGDIAFLRVRTVNIKGWDYFLNVDDGSTGLADETADGMFKDPKNDDEAGWLKIKIGSNLYEMPFWDAD